MDVDGVHKFVHQDGGLVFWSARHLDEYLVLDLQIAEHQSAFRRAVGGKKFGHVLFKTGFGSEYGEYGRTHSHNGP